ncbi:uncharacterized protein LOC125053314 [Pieris napi]|uniref:uncharacterized protein LOC125053314 n=1 Tax=Pieris napi TaxID=78633 RepID=UPI001FB88DF6|nr:uncharacterized protein LOC125053314 [Pieris napi]
MKRRADLIFEKLQIMVDVVPCNYKNDKINKENIPHSIEQRKRKLTQNEYESDTSRPSSSSIIEGTPEKRVLLSNHAHELCDGKRNIPRVGFSLRKSLFNAMK